MTLRRLLRPVVRRVARQLVDGPYHGFLDVQHFASATEPEAAAVEHFLTSDGRRIPVLPRWRYGVKAGWATFAAPALMAALLRRGALGAEDAAWHAHAIGERTLAEPVEAFEARLRSHLPRLAHHFVTGSDADGRLPIIVPTDAEVEAWIARDAAAHQRLLADLASWTGRALPAGARVLEIGFIGGGYSLFAFERLGLQVAGVDNGYGGLADVVGLPAYLKQRLGSRVSFHRGDITGDAPFEPASFDLVFSSSVLEHIPDLGAAFRVIRSLLRPGGLSVHAYQPYHGPAGGHALGTLDAPWAHARLDRADVLRYVAALRPHEAAEAQPWIAGALNRATFADVQRALVGSGMEPVLWQPTAVGRRAQAHLTPAVAADCLQRERGLTLAELVTDNVLVVSRA